jgi:hypothetical protein
MVSEDLRNSDIVKNEQSNIETTNSLINETNIYQKDEEKKEIKPEIISNENEDARVLDELENQLDIKDFKFLRQESIIKMNDKINSDLYDESNIVSLDDIVKSLYGEEEEEEEDKNDMKSEISSVTDHINRRAKEEDTKLLSTIPYEYNDKSSESSVDMEMKSPSKIEDSLKSQGSETANYDETYVYIDKQSLKSDNNNNNNNEKSVVENYDGGNKTSLFGSDNISNVGSIQSSYVLDFMSQDSREILKIPLSQESSDISQSPPIFHEENKPILHKFESDQDDNDKNTISHDFISQLQDNRTSDMKQDHEETDLLFIHDQDTSISSSSETMLKNMDISFESKSMEVPETHSNEIETNIPLLQIPSSDSPSTMLLKVDDFLKNTTDISILNNIPNYVAIESNDNYEKTDDIDDFEELERYFQSLGT